LQCPEIPEFKKGDGLTYRLRNDPANDKLPGYKISVRYFSSGSCEEFLLFETDMRRVFKGQGVNNGPGRFDIARRLLIGGALTTTFNQALSGATETVESFKSCMNAVCESIFPCHACIMQKKLMKNVRKPKGVTIQQFADRIMELNRYRVMVSRSGYQTAIYYNRSLVTQWQNYFRIPEFDMSQLMYESIFSQNFKEKEAIVPSKMASVVTKLPLDGSLSSRPFLMRSI
jgi:hypothetical protein